VDNKIQLLGTGIKRLLIGIGALAVLGVVLALILPDADAPSQSKYERCLERAAEKAQGAVATYNSLRTAMCDKLKPPPSQRSASEFPDSR
jgi:hypothetical protein